jgi:hypothetical protein
MIMVMIMIDHVPLLFSPRQDDPAISFKVSHGVTSILTVYCNHASDRGKEKPDEAGNLAER